MRTDLVPVGVANLFDIAVDPTTGVLYGVEFGTNFYSLDPAGGPATFIGMMSHFVNALDFDQNGDLWGWGGFSFVFIDKGTGATTLVGNTIHPSGGDLAFDIDGTLYGVSDQFDGSNSRLVTIDPKTGADTLVGELPVPAVFGAEIDLDGSLYIATAAGTLFRADKDTATAQFLGVLGRGTGGLAFSLTPVPEPALAILGLSALMTVAALRRRR